MVKIIFEDWKAGMRKIPFTKLLNEKAGLSLLEAKNIKDRLIDHNDIVEIEIENENVAKEILEEARKLNVVGRIEDSLK